ncbi:DUF4870 domain-containing protein [Stenotrophomonas sp.]|uniref:DUF4870 domain-containing protein n=1 Tax=Stenotrophomonas sp. TaxID=69392 RepID=UPI0028A852BF|nr:DUF4870 domain-containing protein [Stenotrophomonas sp.]
MSEFDNITAPPPPPTSAGPVPSDQRTMALVAHLLGIFTGFIGALIIWLINKDDTTKPFVIDQSKEALNFQITIAIAYIVSSILVVVLIGTLMLAAVWVANLVLCILAGVKANNGEAYRYPFTLRLIK